MAKGDDGQGRRWPGEGWERRSLYFGAFALKCAIWGQGALSKRIGASNLQNMQINIFFKAVYQTRLVNLICNFTKRFWCHFLKAMRINIQVCIKLSIFNVGDLNKRGADLRNPFSQTKFTKRHGALKKQKPKGFC